MDGSLHYWNDKLARHAARCTTLVYRVSDTLTYEKFEGNASLVAGAAIADADIAAHLGLTTSPHTAGAFDTTAMDGVDAFGGVVDFGGQVKRVLGMRASYLVTGGTANLVTGCEESASLTASTAKSEVALGTDGNIGFKAILGSATSFSAATTGFVIVELFWESK